MKSYDVIIVGGGAAGMVAAIFAKRKGDSVLLCEKMPKLGKKLLVTGAGRCNLLNEKTDPSFYNPDAQKLVASVFEKFGKEAILGFFKELGLEVYTEPDGRIFPVTNQAASVLKVLELEISRLEVPVKLDCHVRDIRAVAGGFELRTAGEERFGAKKVILCAGGKSYPALGSDGEAYALAKKFGHSITEPVPSTVPLLVKDPWCHFLQGQKVRATVTSRIQNKNFRTASGELLFTQYGLSGTAVLDVSEEISIAMNRDRINKVSVIADLVPFMTEEELAKELERRLARGMPAEHLLEGILPHKLSMALGLKGTVPLTTLRGLSPLLKHKEFKVNGTRGWNEAEFTAGGVALDEIDPVTLGSKLQKGLYFAGEMLDLQGARGGYQLAWAWASGAVVGSAV
ncbi:MAG TPA: NAD(P)/FAD-dependent oxidoreductase [Candidatus Omnitrophota bacterium]|nr:NAD(P)/FAD-dependent oxidoreductase [Candidatus Omnitrophota bacterium]HPS36265.1 NAD(P)/FAD-dependent oxidoreductase [Candidatus Omnitrophota bacterium]